MSEDQTIKDLLREGVEAARAGDKATAREKFEQVTDLDEDNERAWFWLASVVETDEERRVCLSNVLYINPENEKARQMMDKLEAKKRQQADDEEIVPGITRRQLMLIGGGGAAAITILILVVLVILISNNNTQNAIAAQTAEAVLAETNTAQAIVAVQTETAAAIVATQGTDTPTPRDASNVLPPTWTPETEETAPPTEAPPEPPPASVTGSLVMWGGRPNEEGIYDFFSLPISGGFAALAPIGDSRGREIRFAGRGDRVIYTRYFSTTFDFGVELVNVNGTQPQVMQPSVPLLEMGQPDYCAAANRVVFVALPFDTPDLDNLQLLPPLQVFIYDLDNDDTIQITSDGANYSSPAFSPDCTQVAVIRNDVNSADSGADLTVLDIRNIVFDTSAPDGAGEGEDEAPPAPEQGRIEQPLQVIAVTNDLGTFVEATPRWSADGRQIIYSAASATQLDAGNIFIINADGSGTALPVVRSDADDIYPVISPDGVYVAFASNRDGSNYSVYIIRPQDEMIWQITPDSAGNYYPGGWWQQ